MTAPISDASEIPHHAPLGASDASDSLEGAYRSRHEHREMPIVCCIGYSIPEEVISAAGFAPIHIVGASDLATPAGDVYMEEGFTHEVRSIFNQVIAGEWDHAALIVIDRAYRDIYYYLKELVRLGSAPSLPPLHLFDFMLSQRMPVDDYNDVQLHKLLDAVGRCAGRPVEEVELREAILASNQRRKELRRLAEHRTSGRIPGLTAFRAIGAGRVLGVDEHRALLAQLNEDLDNVSPSSQPRLVLISAEQLFHDQVHEVVEIAGAIIVAEDDRWGSRAGGDDVVLDASPANSLRVKYHADAVGPELTPFSARAAWLDRFLTENRVDGIVFYVPASDTRFGWDYPEMRRIAKGFGVESVLINDDVLLAEGRDAASSTIADYLRTSALSMSAAGQGAQR